MRSTTVYRTGRNGEVIKLPAGVKTLRESYDATVDVPQSKRVLDAYYQLEQEHKLKDTDFHISANATRDIHRRRLQELGVQP